MKGCIQHIRLKRSYAQQHFTIKVFFGAKVCYKPLLNEGIDNRLWENMGFQ
jgi:hypothetical protein